MPCAEIGGKLFVFIPGVLQHRRRTIMLRDFDA